MANYCHNAVSFTGDLAQLIRLKLLFTEMEKDSQAKGTMAKPDFVKAEKGYMFDIGVGDEAIHFRTRWVPNLEVIFETAQHFGLDYVHRYEEPDMLVYGEATCKNGKFAHIYLEPADFKDIRYDAASESFSYKGESADDPFNFWHTLLEEKKQAEALIPAIFKTTSSTSKTELEDLLGELLTGDLFLKLAEQKNFRAAKDLFETWDEETVAIMDNYLIAEFQHSGILDRNRDEYIALLFLQDLIDKQEPKNELKLNPDAGNRPVLKR